MRAENAMARKDMSAAVVDIKTALQQKPADPDARRLLGEIYLFQQQAKAAADELERSLRSAFDTATARNFVKALHLAGDQQRIIDLENEIFFQTMRSDGEYLAARARALAAQGDLGLAAERGERREQLVRGVRREAPLAERCRFEPAE
ncbi:MAG: tetratricopeptide repeat protein [Halieaceae bacterium]|nr:tetratricopeptide repeat protein [Halieaceae bacterium]